MSKRANMWEGIFALGVRFARRAACKLGAVCLLFAVALPLGSTVQAAVEYRFDDCPIEFTIPGDYPEADTARSNNFSLAKHDLTLSKTNGEEYFKNDDAIVIWITCSLNKDKYNQFKKMQKRIDRKSINLSKSLQKINKHFCIVYYSSYTSEEDMRKKPLCKYITKNKFHVNLLISFPSAEMYCGSTSCEVLIFHVEGGSASAMVQIITPDGRRDRNLAMANEIIDSVRIRDVTADDQ